LTVFVNRFFLRERQAQR